MNSHHLKQSALTAMLSASLIAPSVAEITLEVQSSVITGNPSDLFDESAAEIVAYDPKSARLFVVNGFSSAIDIIDISDVSDPQPVATIDTAPFGDAPTSVSVDPKPNSAEIAVAVPAAVVTDPGSVVFFDIDGNLLNQLTVGALPDMLTYDKNGKTVLVANEGEPEDGVDPEGSVAIIDVKKGAAKAKQSDVEIVGFAALNGMAATLQAAGVRLFPEVIAGDITVAQDLEPEYVAVSADGKRAFVALQEANAIAEIDLKQRQLVNIFGLGAKDHSLPGNGLDASDRDDAINIANWPVNGLYMPDAIAAFRTQGTNYIVSANEGDDRGEDERIKDLVLDPTAFPNAADLQEDENLGRLGVSTIDGDTDGDGDYDQLFSYGSRSFTIWTEDGEVVFDSGDDFEQVTAVVFPDNFNANNDENDAEGRSDNKGPEQEAVVIGKLKGKVYAFVGLERIGGVMIYDVTDPANASFVNYVNNRDFTGDAELNDAGDLGPEGLLFVPGKDSPNGEPLLVVANEVSGTTTVFQIVAE